MPAISRMGLSLLVPILAWHLPWEGVALLRDGGVGGTVEGRGRGWHC